MAGPRLTAPAAKLARSISSAATSTAKPSPSVLTPVARKYAELLKEKTTEGSDHPRQLYTRSATRPQAPAVRSSTTHLMQTFTTSSPRPLTRADPSTMDHTVIPLRMGALEEDNSTDDVAAMRMPLLPDNFATSHPPETLLATEAALPIPEISTADPESAVAAPLSEVEGMTMDGVELKFAHEGPSSLDPRGRGGRDEAEPGMLADLWNGLVEDVFGGGSSGGKNGKGGKHAM